MASTQKSGKQMQWEFRVNDNGDWRDVVSILDGSFVEPSWIESHQYRLKPKPEVVKPKWPESGMSEDELYDAYASAYGCFERYRSIANAAIAHALETGLVVLPETTVKPTHIDYKEGLDGWGSVALDSALNKFVEIHRDKEYGSIMDVLALRAAILKYLECVERDAK